MKVAKGDLVRVGSRSSTATVLEVLPGVDEAGVAYEMAVLQGALNREFREETSRLTVVKKAGTK